MGGKGRKTCTNCSKQFTELGQFWLSKDESSPMAPFCSECVAAVAKPCTDFTVSEEYHNSSINSETPTTIIGFHGGHLSRASLRPAARELTKLGYNVLLVDLPGHGSRVKEALSTQSIVSVMESSLELADTRWPGTGIYLLGHSLGAYAIYLSIRDLSKSNARNSKYQNVKGVVSTGASALYPFPRFFRFLLWLTKKMPDQKKHQLMLEHELPKNWSPTLKYETITGSGQYWNIISEMVETFKTFSTTDSISELSKRLPLLLCNYKGDTKGRIGAEKALIKHFPDSCTLVKLDGKHLGPMTHASEFATTVSEWITNDRHNDNRQVMSVKRN